MVELVAKSACAGLVPVRLGDVLLTEEAHGALTSLMPRRDGEAALAAALEAAHGLALPAPGECAATGPARLLWFGLGQYLLMGPEPGSALAETAALTDQTDAWAVMRLEGAGAREVLARLVPVDLRNTAFAEGQCVRTEIAHAIGALARVGAEAWLLLCFRSMAEWMVHEITTAMEARAARM